jgi:hypothetical protein
MLSFDAHRFISAFQETQSQDVLIFDVLYWQTALICIRKFMSSKSVAFVERLQWIVLCGLCSLAVE